MSRARRCAAEAAGTFWLVLAGAGSAVLAASFPELGIGHLGVSLAFGLALLTAAYAVGHISGCHVNPAVTVGLAAGGRFPAREIPFYVVAQVLGAIAAGAVLLAIARGAEGFSVDGGFASNGYGARSPGGYDLGSAFLVELLFTAVLVFVLMGVTDVRAPVGLAPLAIGLCLALVHLVTIPVTNTSVNPARSTGVAVFAGRAALSQLWLFWVAPLVGGLVGGVAYRALAAERPVVPREVAQTEDTMPVTGREPAPRPA